MIHNSYVNSAGGGGVVPQSYLINNGQMEFLVRQDSIMKMATSF